MVRLIQAAACVGLLAVCGAVAQNAAEPAPVGDVTAHKKSNEKLRGQLLSFAPYISMYNNKLTLGQSKIADVLDELNKLKEFNDNRFDGSEALKRSSNDVISFLVLSQGRITPALKNAKVVSIDPALAAAAGPEFFFAAGLLELFAEAAKQNDLRNWQTEYDVRCRSAYRSLLPDLRSIAKGERVSPSPISVISSFDKADWVYLAAVNNSQKTLTNVTLRVKLTTIDGRSSEHFYFIDTWPAEKRKYPLRIAGDWMPGARATTSASVELISDEIIAPSVESRIDDNVPIAADLYFDELEKQIHGKRQLKIAIDRLELMTDPVSRYPERAEKRQGLETRARDFLETILKDIDAKIKKEEKDIENARKGMGNARSESSKNHHKKIFESSTEELKKLKDDRADWVSGKK